MSMLGQHTPMTPQLQQAFRLLQLPEPALQALVQQALETNVMLQADEAFDATWALESHSDLEADELLLHAADENAARTSASGPTLHEHLAWQLEEAPLPNGPRAIGRALIDAINDDGYLTKTPQAIAAEVAGAVRADAGVVESVLGIIQQFDPVGVGARTPSECIGLQLAQLEPGTAGLDAAQRIARHHLELAAGGYFRDLQRLTGCSGAEVETALALIRSCHRRPGAAFDPLRAEYAVPDVFARRISCGWTVELNPAAAPRLRLNERYADMVTGSPDHANLRAQLQEARWLVGSLEMRNDMVLKVARTIVYQQLAFLGRSEQSLRPMTLAEVAEAVEMHESTVSRVTTGKYLHTPRGVFEFRFFFSQPAGSRRMLPAA
jgi:RNA polymerase sigma-54 factor